MNGLTTKYSTVFCQEEWIFNIMNFPTYDVEVDMSDTQPAQEYMADLTNSVDAECPFAYQLAGVKGGGGEGIVWTCVDNTNVSSVVQDEGQDALHRRHEASGSKDKFRVLSVVSRVTGARAVMDEVILKSVRMATSDDATQPEPMSESDDEDQPELMSESDDEDQPEPMSESDYESQPEPEPMSDSDYESQPEPEPMSDDEPKPEPAYQPAHTFEDVSGMLAPSGNAGYQLWVDKYKPTNTRELVGNNTLIATLRMWLSNWEGVNLRGQQPQAPPGSRKNPKDLSKKAVLLSGPPGIGKTSAAHILAKECNFEIVEMNASDTRNKSDSKISAGMGGKSANMIKEMATNRSLLVGADGKMKKQLLIMDEIDGMSGGDRGGVQDLIQTIKSSKVPIICICNDKWNLKLKSLRNYCVELDFRSPTPHQVKIRMMEICRKEGLTVNDATIEALAKGANCNLRSILGQLQMVRLSRTTLSYDEVKGSQACDKDSDLSPFECARKLLEPASSSMSIQDRLNLAMVDDIVPC
eukprot:gene32096-biopygen9572